MEREAERAAALAAGSEPEELEDEEHAMRRKQTTRTTRTRRRDSVLCSPSLARVLRSAALAHRMQDPPEDWLRRVLGSTRYRSPQPPQTPAEEYCPRDPTAPKSMFSLSCHLMASRRKLDEGTALGLSHPPSLISIQACGPSLAQRSCWESFLARTGAQVLLLKELQILQQGIQHVNVEGQTSFGCQ